MPMSPADLIQGYLENELSEEASAVLQHWLEEEPGHLDQLIMEAFLDSQLRSVLGESKVRKDMLSLVCAGDAAASPVTAGVDALRIARSDTARRGSAADVRRYFPSIAAVVAVVALLAACLVVVVGTIARRPGAGQVMAQPKAKSPSAAPCAFSRRPGRGTEPRRGSAVVGQCDRARPALGRRPVASSRCRRAGIDI